MKKVLLLLVLVCAVTSYGQEEFLKVSLKGIKNNSALINNVHLLENDKSGKLSIFIEEAKTTYGFQYEGNKQTAQLTSQGLKRKYKEIIGQAQDDGKVRLIQKNTTGTKFASILYDFDNKITEETEYDIDLSDQKFLQSYSHGTACYVFTIVKNSSVLKKWAFKLDGSVTSNAIHLDSKIALSSRPSLDIYNLIQEKEGLKSFVNLVKVENRLPNSLNIAAEKNKMYEHRNGFLWTLDDNSKYTVLLDFQMPDLDPKITFVPKPSLQSDKSVISNSYNVDNILAQIVSDNSEMILQFKDIETFKVIKEYSIDKTDEITFRNTPILQEGATYSFGGTRKMEKTSKFLRKIASDKNGISLVRSQNGYRAIIGGVRPASGGGGFAALGTLASVGPAFLSFNPASFSYGSYGYTGSTRIESFFNQDFEHQEGELPPNIFDAIEELSGNWSKNADNVYMIDDYVLFGNYQSSIKSFNLFKFDSN